MSEEKDTFLGMELGGLAHLLFIGCCIAGVIGLTTFAINEDEERKDNIPKMVTLFTTPEGCTAYRYYDRQRRTYEYFMACKSGGYTMGKPK